MNDRNIPVTEDELHAYVDGELPAERYELALFGQGYHWLLRDLKPEKVQARILDWMAARSGAGGAQAERPPD